jgi:ParB/RepB/Spo0J family partition protein
MEVRSVLIDSIIVNDRQRKLIEREPLSALAKDIEQHGLLHPIVVTRSGTLMAGERRLEACKLLGWTHIPANFLEDLPERQRFLIEFTENERRQSLTWEERTKAIFAYHDMSIKEEGSGWTQEKTADDLGLAQNSISRYLTVFEELEHPLVKKATSIKTAVNTVKRIHERRDQDTFYGLSTVDKYIPDHPIQIADFSVWAPSYSGPKFNLIHIDFPYGINAHKTEGQSSALEVEYTDTPKTFWTLFKTLSVELDRFCSPAAHMIFWFSPSIYIDVWNALKLLDGFQWDEHPLIWMRGVNEGIAPDPQRRPRRCYEMAFFGWRGDRKLVQTKSNIFQAPTEREDHPHEKNEEMLRHFFGMVVDQGTRLFDPTCGSGSALRAGKSLGAEIVLGLETSSDYAIRARRAFDAANSSGSGIGRGNGISDPLAGGQSPVGQSNVAE